MAQNTTTQGLRYYADNATIREICKEWGDQLQVLSGIEKFHLAMVLAGVLAHWATLADEDDDDDGDEFAELFEPMVDEESTLEGWAAHNLAVEVSGDVIDVLKAMEPLQPEVIASLLPAIAIYALEDNR